ncbi:MAG: hypothetical protein NBV68_13115 [Erythrobacter sp.]|uniref:hypothetical protein n=1 Tax=Erythrobacter sp. TaxID=1042 RepID=UPI0025F52A0A|nr:hypothetical protein [Erythrobacter sp.]MCM0000319.1 hypothetical protein [Erythrobacter sp.]
MIGRIVWFVSLAGLALLTAGLQLDLLAARAPGLALLLPEPLRNASQTAITSAALAGNDSGRALAEAQRLVQRRPVPARSLVLLTVAQARAGKAEQAAKTIQVAARRGWREPLAQEAMLRLALAAGDKPEAARRYAALFLRTRTPDALLRELGPMVLDGPDKAARDTMVEIVVGGERWHTTFLRRGVRLMPPAAFAAIAEGSIARGVQFDCRVLKISVDSLTGRDDEAAATLRAAGMKRCPKLGG